MYGSCGPKCGSRLTPAGNLCLPAPKTRARTSKIKREKPIATEGWKRVKPVGTGDSRLASVVALSAAKCICSEEAEMEAIVGGGVDGGAKRKWVWEGEEDVVWWMGTEREGRVLRCSLLGLS